MSDTRETLLFQLDTEQHQARKVLVEIERALREKGYDPIPQIVGYLMTGDPTYITRNARARTLIRKVERDRIIEELVRAYLKAGR